MSLVIRAETCLAGRERHRPCFLRFPPKKALPHTRHHPFPPVFASGASTFSSSLKKKSFFSLQRPSLLHLHHGGIRAIPDLRYHIRDHKPVRIACDCPAAEPFAKIWILGIRTCNPWAWAPSALSGMLLLRIARTAIVLDS